jgi:hypothetical protein
VTPLAKQIRLVAMAAVILFLVAVAVAVARPGDLGDDKDRSAAPVGATSTTTSAPPVTASQSTSSTTSTTSTPQAGAPSSGLGATGSGAVQQRNLANTGGETSAAPAVALLAAALVLRRVRSPRAPSA